MPWPMHEAVRLASAKISYVVALRRHIGPALAVWLGMVMGWTHVSHAQTARADGRERVDLELVLAVDASASISSGALDFQLKGHAAAFRDPIVTQAFEGSIRTMAVTVAAFAGPHTLEVLAPWTLVGSPKDALAFADTIEKTSRSIRTGSTALGSAIADATDLLLNNGFSGDRMVIDLVSNGFNNSGVAPEAPRDQAVEAGITINALAILDEYDWLEGYYLDSVIGGPFAFVRTVDRPDSFAQALARKLIAEIVGLPPDMVVASRDTR